MEKYLEITQQSSLGKKHSHVLIGFRVYCEDDEDIRQWYLFHFMKWLDYAGFQPLSWMTGIHRDSGNHHFHFHSHTYTSTKIYKKPWEAVKYAFDNGKIDLVYPDDSTRDKYPKTFHKNKHEKMSNISIQQHIKDDNFPPEDLTRWFQYPLKEGTHMGFNLPNDIDVNQLTLNAKAEYAAVMEKKKKEQAKEEAASDNWKSIVKMLDDGNPDSHETVLRYILNHFKNLEEKPPTLKHMADLAERYSFKRGIISVNEIIRRTMNRYI